MSVQTTVEIGVFLTTGDAPYFRLNDPVKGKLDNPDYRLAGPIFYDITDNVTSVSVKRGKNRELERYSAGQATVVLNNETRLFDPLNEASVFFGNIIPRRAIRIRSGGFNQFNGVVEDWNLDYDVSGKSDASIAAADGFALLAQQTLTPGTATPQTTGERVNAVLSMPSVAWPLVERNIDTGVANLGADVFDGNVLSYLQEVETSEQGQFFISKGGRVRFINGAVTPTSDLVEILFSDEGDGVPYTGATVSYGTELLFNDVEVTSPAGVFTASNEISQTKYGITQTTVKTLLSTNAESQALADFWVAKYGEPEYRFQELDVDVDGLNDADLSTVLQLELGDIVSIKFTPNGVGSPIIRNSQISSIAHNISPGRHTIQFGVSSLQFTFLVLDDVEFGILDENVLAF
jgi:hypothetical protein